MERSRGACWALAGALLAAGCAPLELEASRSPLMAPELGPDGVVLDVLSVRVPVDHPLLGDPLWSQVDEQHLPAALRGRLAENGIRAGVLGSRWPPELEALLGVDEQPAAPPSEAAPTASLQQEPIVRRRQLRIRSGQRSEVITSGEAIRHERLPVFVRDAEGRVSGRTYSKAMALWATTAEAQADGVVRLRMVPEVEHGEPRRRFAAQDGVMRVDFGPPHEVFDQLAVEAALAPGEALLVSADPARPGTAGQRFFVEEASGARYQKLLLVRLAHTERDDRFQAADAAPAGTDAPRAAPKFH